jgi:delta 1-pyrroline-5-carboxylate dehydrogenase
MVSQNYFVKPTVFADVRNDMTIARKQIFGPVLSIIPYEDEEDAVRIANDTPYGLSGFVTSGNLERARRVARRIRSGNVHVNGARVDFGGCFGGFKQSGNGREWGEAGLEEFLELKQFSVTRPRSRIHVWDRDIPPKLRDRTKTGPRAGYAHNLLGHIYLSEFADRAEREYNVTPPLSRLAHFPP